jgi:hypothetical protein
MTCALGASASCGRSSSLASDASSGGPGFTTVETSFVRGFDDELLQAAPSAAAAIATLIVTTTRTREIIEAEK